MDTPESQNLRLRIASLADAQPQPRVGKSKSDPADFLKLTGAIREKINEGAIIHAQESLVSRLENEPNSLDEQAVLYSLLSQSLREDGKFVASHRILKEFEDESIAEKLSPHALATMQTQLAEAYISIDDFPKAIAVIKAATELAEKRDLTESLSEIYGAFSLVYIRLNEYPISRNYGEKSMKYARETGDWLGLAKAYKLIGDGYLYEGNTQKALDYFNQGIKIVGNRTAPFLLAGLYTNASLAYLFLNQPREGVDCANRAINVIKNLPNVYWAGTPYNNLSNNLILLGNWDKAEEAINKCLELTTDDAHPNRSMYFDTLGDLACKRGKFEDARAAFEQGIALAESQKKEWYVVQMLCNLASCLLAENKIDAALEKAKEAAERCNKFSERRFVNIAGLIMAECYLKKDEAAKMTEALQLVEESDLANDFFAVGEIARLRAMLAQANGEEELEINYLNQSYSVAEMAGNAYQKALADAALGKALSKRQPDKAFKHLTSAAEAFTKLGNQALLDPVKQTLENLDLKTETNNKEESVSAQLLMMRLAESTASRELLMRELIAIIQQEGKARKTLFAELDEQKKFHPTVIDGFSSGESVELVAKFNEALNRKDLDNFAVEKNVSIHQLRTPSAPPAVLMISPRSGAVLSDGSSILPLIRVAELGFDICALRERDKDNHNDYESAPIASQSILPGFIHSSPAMTGLIEEVNKIRSSDVTVLITGESGTGKELVSRAIHALSRRKDKIFVPFNCTAVPKELTEGHLFGYKRGAFTGAQNDSPGMIRAAHGGTLFLDEIGDLPLDVQPKILRFLQESEVQPLGEKAPIKVDVRIIAATNMDLEDKVAKGLFREDLFYRLNVIRLRVPPLRERKSEIPQMVNYYINHYSGKFGRKNLSIAEKTMDILIAHNWEGNVRQLCNEVQRLVARADNGEKIVPGHLSPDVIRAVERQAPAPRNSSGSIRSLSLSGSYHIESQGRTLDEAVSELEIQMITDSMRRHNGVISHVAKELGLTRRGLYLKLDRYKLNREAIA